MFQAISNISERDILTLYFIKSYVKVVQTGYIGNPTINLINSTLNTIKGIDRLIFIYLENSKIIINKYFTINTILLDGECEVKSQTNAEINSLMMFATKNLTLKSKNHIDIVAEWINVDNMFEGENITIRVVSTLSGVTPHVSIDAEYLKLSSKININPTKTFRKFRVDRLSITFHKDNNDSYQIYNELIGKDFEIIRSESNLEGIDIYIDYFSTTSLFFDGRRDIIEVWASGCSIYYRMKYNPFNKIIKACRGCSTSDENYFLDAGNSNWTSAISDSTEEVIVQFKDLSKKPFEFPIKDKKIKYSLISDNDMLVIIDPTNIHESVSDLVVKCRAIFTKPIQMNIQTFQSTQDIIFSKGTTFEKVNNVITDADHYDQYKEFGSKNITLYITHNSELFLYNGYGIINKFRVELYPELLVTLTGSYLTITNVSYAGNLRLTCLIENGNVRFNSFSRNVTIPINVFEKVTINSNGFCPAVVQTDSEYKHLIIVEKNIYHPQLINWDLFHFLCPSNPMENFCGLISEVIRLFWL